MTRLCLDTSAYSHFKRGEPKVVAQLERATWVGVPTVVIGELTTGFLLGSRRERNELELLDFLAHPATETLPVDGEVARIYADVVVDLRAAGTPVPTNDIWIAACAARSGSTVVTFDPHFTAIARIGALVL